MKAHISVWWVKQCGKNKNTIIHIAASPLGTPPVPWSVLAALASVTQSFRRHFIRTENTSGDRTRTIHVLYQSYNLFKYTYNSSYALLYSRYFIYLLCGRCLLYLQWNSVTTNKNIDFAKIHRRAVTHKHRFFLSFFFMSCKDTEKCSCA